MTQSPPIHPNGAECERCDAPANLTQYSIHGEYVCPEHMTDEERARFQSLQPNQGE